jgi:hypothetical protein
VAICIGTSEQHLVVENRHAFRAEAEAGLRVRTDDAGDFIRPSCSAVGDPQIISSARIEPIEQRDLRDIPTSFSLIGFLVRTFMVY